MSETKHDAAVHGYGFLYYWACSCGRSGQPTTNGRANAGRDRHLLSEWRKASKAQRQIGTPKQKGEV